MEGSVMSVIENGVLPAVQVKDIIQKINGKLITNPKIDTTKIGVQEITFNYIL